MLLSKKKFTVSCPLKSPACHRKIPCKRSTRVPNNSSSRSHRQRKTEGKRELTPNNFSGDLPEAAGNVFVPCVVREQVDAPLADVRSLYLFGCSFLSPPVLTVSSFSPFHPLLFIGSSSSIGNVLRLLQ